MKFKELNKLAKCRAIVTYVDGWIDTHGELDGLSYNEVIDILENDLEDESYDCNGYLIDSE